jgi:hypothetical protein
MRTCRELRQSPRDGILSLQPVQVAHSTAFRTVTHCPDNGRASRLDEGTKDVVSLVAAAEEPVVVRSSGSLPQPPPRARGGTRASVATSLADDARRATPGASI